MNQLPHQDSSSTSPASAPGRARESDGFWGSSALVFAFSNGASLLNFLFQLTLAQLLPTSTYGIVGAMVALVMLLSMPGQALQMAFVRRATRWQQGGAQQRVHKLYRRVRTLALVLGLGYLLALVLGLDALRALYQLESAGPLWVAVGAGAAGLLFYVGAGTVQVRQDFLRLGICHFGMSVFRFGVGALGAATLATAVAALGGLLLGPIFIALWLNLRWQRERLHSATNPDHADATSPTPFRSIVRETAPYLLTLGAFVVLLNLDITYVQAYFGGGESNTAGLYNAAATLGKTVLYLPLAIVSVTFTKVSDAHAAGLPHRHYLWKNLALSAVVSGAGLGLLGGFPEPILRLYGGGEDLVGAAGYLRRTVWSMLFLGWVAVFMNYYFALGRKTYATLILLGAVTAMILFEVRHERPEDIIHTLIGVNGGLVVLGLLLLPWLGRSAPTGSEVPIPPLPKETGSGT